MSYLEHDDAGLIDDLLTRKEFYWTKKWSNPVNSSITNNIIPRFLLDPAISSSGYLKLLGQQVFVKNYFSPDTDYKRLHIDWSTGAGKTLAGLSISMNFIKNYAIENSLNNTTIGSVFIIGFSERAFKHELLKYPEFGFISYEERENLNKLKKIANTTGFKSDIDSYHELITKIKKRFTNRKNNGFFRFFGYKAFVNRIFVPGANIDISTMTEDQIRIALENSSITFNTQLLKEFENSLIICDEIHNVYNSAEKNNWGIAIQSVLDAVDSARCVTLSATPLNNTPSEIVDLLNLLLPKNQRVSKYDLFHSDNKTLKPHALETIGKLSVGRFSFLLDINPKHYPKIIPLGSRIKSIPYLQFVRCVMSDYHYRTYEKVYTGALSQDSQYLVDFVLPNPSPSSTLGIYQTGDIKKLIANADTTWKEKNKIDYKNHRIIGDICQMGNLRKFSSKYATMVEHLYDSINNDQGKVFIYHNIVHMSGVLFIEQVLLKNGFIDEYSSSNDSTICCICGKIRKDHTTVQISGGSLDEYSSTLDKAVINSSEGIDEDHSDGDSSEDNIDEDHSDGDSSEDNDEDNDEDNSTHELIQDDSKYQYVYSWKIYNDMPVCSVLENEDNYFINNTFHRDLLNGDSKLLDAFNKHILNKFNDKPMFIKVKNSIGKPLGNWLLQNKFVLFSRDDLDLYSILLKDVVHLGGKSRQNPKKTQLKTQPKPQLKTQPKPQLSTQLASVDHKFTPARFIIAHSDIEKNVIEQSIDRYNSIDNVLGHKFMILIGSKVLKESYDIKAIQNVYIMGKPDNIPTLIQIRGRAVRKGSHEGLPEHKRVVRVKIFTTCLPIKYTSGVDAGDYKLSYEEEKYKEKIEAFQVIQNIERVLHENAIDAVINYDKISSNLSLDPLGPLKYVPKNLSKYKKEFKLDELNLSTFNVHHAKSEIQMIKILIKRLFIELSSVWEYTDLFNAVKRPPSNYEQDINTNLISEVNFSIALSQLVYLNDGDYTNPFIKKKTISGGMNLMSISQNIDENHPGEVISEGTYGGMADGAQGGYSSSDKVDYNVITKLYDVNDKIIKLPNGYDSVLVNIQNANSNYIILFPLNSKTNKPDIDIEIPYRITKMEESTVINMNSFVQNKRVDFDYDDKKKIFFHRYENISIENMENVICEYGANFHIKFAEECVEYVFNTWTDPKSLKSEHHEFLFKMLYYYDLMSLIMFAYTSKPRVFKDYEKYAIPVRSKDIKLKAVSKYDNRKDQLEDISPDDNSDLISSGVINLLKSTFNRTSNTWIPAEFRKQYDETIAKSLKLFEGRKKKISSITKISADLLPIGHYIDKFPKIYHPEKGWDENPVYLQNEQEFKENNIAVGFDERSTTGIHIRFKIRNPIHNIKKHHDSRQTEKGTVCKSKSKEYLKTMAEKLGAVVPDKINVDELCVIIRSKLIRLELIERIKKSNIKYFYFFYEPRPETK